MPESKDTQMPPELDVAGAAAGVVGLGGVTYSLIEAPDHGLSEVAIPLLVGLAGLVSFVLIERRSRHPLIPLDIFTSRQFTAANLVTFALYAALSSVFFLLAITLQVSVGLSPLEAGAAFLPITVIMLALSARAGALASRIGPRRPMTFGPLIVTGALLLMLRIRPGSSYLFDILPAVIVFGLGLALTVAPLTAAVLAAAENRHAGVASGVNNAVARTAGLLAVAVAPIVMGLSGEQYEQPVALAHGFHTAVLWCAGLVAVSALIAWFGIRDDVLAHADDAPEADDAPPGPTQPSDAQSDATWSGAAQSDAARSGPAYHCALNAPPPAT